jgi:hypothetical protein
MEQAVQEEKSPILSSSAEEIDAIAEELQLRDFEIPDEHDEELGDLAISLDSSAEPPREEEEASAPKAAAKAKAESSASQDPPRTLFSEKLFPPEEEHFAITSPIRRSSLRSKGEQVKRGRNSSTNSSSNSNKYMQGFLHQVRIQSGFTTDCGMDDDDLTTDNETETDRKPRASSPLHHRQQPQHTTTTAATTTTTTINASSLSKLSTEDIEICQRLDDEYERALEEREIGYNARYASVRQSAFLSVFFMCTYLCLGTLFFMRQAAWTIPDSLLFSIYTITTVGYGTLGGAMPTTPGFQSYTIFYILVGIAALTIMASWNSVYSTLD